MPDYRRADVKGGIFFFTVTLADRSSDLLIEAIGRFREIYRSAQQRRPFETMRPLAGRFVGGHIGMRVVFLGTSVMVALGAIFYLVVKRRGAPHDAGRNVECRGANSVGYRSRGARRHDIARTSAAVSMYS